MAKQDVYFKGIKRKSDVDRLKDAGLTDKELASLGYKPTKKKEKKKKPNWAEKLKMGVTKHLGKKYHSPAGRKYMAGEVKKYGK